MTLAEFTAFAESYTVVPVWRTLLADTLTPVSVYLRLRRSSRVSFLFESVEGGEHFGRYSFIGVRPHIVIRSQGSTTTISSEEGVRHSTESTFEILDSLISRYRQPALPDLPRCTGGLIGYLGYDSVRTFERLEAPPPDPVGFADSAFGLFTSVVAFDHLKHQLHIIANVLIDDAKDPEAQYYDEMAELGRIEALLADRDGSGIPGSFASGEMRPEIDRDRFESLVRRAQHHIREGDVFQIVLSQRFSAPFSGDLFNVYRALRIVNPSPYLYFLDFDGEGVIGSSPELLVRAENGRAEICPIAGTRPRGATDREDTEFERALLADEKERAEHVMLVDLGRNDLGKVCEPGSVRVEEFIVPVRYSHVMHLASRLTGTPSSAIAGCEIVKAAFPAGTVTGAPKIRAMQLIDELEPSRRGVYAGGVGYFDFSGRLDFCIAIRTFFAKGGVLHVQAGAGIVADSDPGREYEETMHKARALFEALKIAKGICG